MIFGTYIVYESGDDHFMDVGVFFFRKQEIPARPVLLKRVIIAWKIV
jgi:hypothetical protein